MKIARIEHEGVPVTAVVEGERSAPPPRHRRARPAHRLGRRAGCARRPGHRARSRSTARVCCHRSCRPRSATSRSSNATSRARRCCSAGPTRRLPRHGPSARRSTSPTRARRAARATRSRCRPTARRSTSSWRSWRSSAGRAATSPAQDAGSHIVGLHDLQRLVGARHRAAASCGCRSASTRPRTSTTRFGPWIVTPDELEPYRDGDRLDLSLQASINGEPLGEPDTLRSMAWSFEELVAFSAHGASIQAGDVIGCGTCANGCLMELWGRNQSWTTPPPLRPGDVVTLEVEGIGTLTNTIVRQDVPDLGLGPARA